MSKAQELKLCPFCNGSRAFVSDSESTAIHIVCRDCGAQLWGCKRHFSDEASAISAWNTRAPASSEQQAAQQDAALIDVLCGIRRYGLDTLSGRTDGPDDREWHREAIKVMTSRAAKGIAAARASNGGKA